MLLRTLPDPVPASAAAVLRGRRLAVLGANLATLAAVALAGGWAASSAGWRAVDIVLLLCVLAATPWNAIGFWNSAIGFWLLHVKRHGLPSAAPFLAGVKDKPVTMRTAILMTLRNEDPERAISRLRAVKAELDDSPYGGAFEYFVLSDTSLPDIAQAEEAAMTAWRAMEGGVGLHYRRRNDNEGFKAGNVRDFCRTHGAHFEAMLPLDADSLMGASTILSMVRIMQSHPRLGILQSLVVGLPSQSAFARLFQFGMRHGMRCYTLGSAWWGGDCGPYWGHNALVRIAPFAAHCHLPVLPGAAPLGGPILSHDQVEAVLMRAAGYEVRVLPVESESYEENPPTLPEFVRRDLRWCMGNLQYIRLIGTPGLLPAGLPATSRFQLIWAILMFATQPAVPLALLLLPLAAWGAPPLAAAIAAGLYGAIFLFSLAPKLFGLADVALSPGGAARYGGPLRFAVSAVSEIVFSLLLGAITSLSVTGLLFRMVLGRARAGWNGQARDPHRVAWSEAAAALWPVTAYGLVAGAGAAAISPLLLAYVTPLLAGCWLAIPFAVLSADPRLGRFMVRTGLCALPEEAEPPAILTRLTDGEPERPAQAA
ncbi:glucans biosynthesis glucosyltransferase MdoH [Aquabacter sediminis]|uniref:glucans biosynthesis glucosyltransferase MdoH n=1 Tax=Aquabacter sediminis TaxID=3029197 RepID=UPI00237E2484|nr:glucans biosynthesis glucosyltransferase MdoH [Aquabacter sp. P-9]MDE1568881.1 glucans biosynthesis glucosyltransferase MdoH [Aquabacter sp. P-9]